MLIQIGYLLLRVVLALMTAEGCLQAVNYARVKGISPDEERLNSTLHKLFGFGPKLIEHPGLFPLFFLNANSIILFLQIQSFFFF